MVKRNYIRNDFDSILGHLVEECGEVLGEIESLRSQLSESRKLCTAFEESVGEDVGTILTLKARITELEANEARLSILWIAETRRVEELETAEKARIEAYESILGPRTYNEVAEHIRGLEEALRVARAAIREEAIEHAIHDIKTMQCLGDFLDAALSHAGPVARDGEHK